jgi:hypothetical protein
LLQDDVNPDPDIYLQRVIDSPTGVRFQTAADPTRQDDLKCAVDLNRFPFALQVHRQNERHILKPVHA